MIRPEGFTHCKEYECGRRLSSRQTEVKLNVRRRQSQILLCVLRPRVVVVERELILPPHSLYPTVSKHRTSSRGQAFRKHVFVIIWTNQHTTFEVMPLNARDYPQPYEPTPPHTYYARLTIRMGSAKNSFHELVEKATSPLIPSGHEDIYLYFEISDHIRAKDVTPEFAIKELKRRLSHTNPNIQLFGLSVCCVVFVWGEILT